MFVAAVLLMPQTLHALTIMEAVDDTLRTNPQVLEAYDREMASTQVVKQARAGYYPTLSLDAAIGKERSENSSTAPDTRSLTRNESGIEISQMLFDGFAVRSSVDRSLARERSAAEQTAGARERLGFRAAEVFLEVLRQQELTTVAQAYLDAHQRRYTQVMKRAESGVGSRSEQDQAQARLALAKASLLEVRRSLRDAEINFERTVGYVPLNLVKPGDICCDFLPPTRENAVDIAYSHHPDVLASVADYEAELAQHQGAKALLSPRVDLDVGAGWDENVNGAKGPDDELYAMLRVHQNVYRGGADEARIKETGYQALASEKRLRAVKRQVEGETRLAWHQLETAQKRLVYLQRHAESSASARDSYIKQYELGDRTLLDLLDAEAEMFTAQSNYINGQYEERVARYRLLAEMGMLMETLGFKAPSGAAVE